MADSVIEYARGYLAAGLSPIPVGHDKRPTGKWGQYQLKRAEPDDLPALFAGALGVGIACGEGSGGLEVIDFDIPKGGVLTGSREHIDAFFAFASEDGILPPDAPVIETPSGGRHLYLRRNRDVEGNRKLAMAEDGETLIETRGQGGQVVAPGSSKLCAEGVGVWRQTGGLPLDQWEDVDPISEEHYSDLIALCRQFHRGKDELVPFEVVGSAAAGQHRPGDEYNRAKGSNWMELLAPLGWRALRSTPQGVLHVRRPGKEKGGLSATIGYRANPDGVPYLYVFTSNAHPLQPNKAYTPFSFLATTEYGGDFSACAQGLSAQGYGSVGANIEAVKEAVKVALEHAKRGGPALQKDLEAVEQVAARLEERASRESAAKEGVVDLAREDAREELRQALGVPVAKVVQVIEGESTYYVTLDGGARISFDNTKKLLDRREWEAGIVAACRQSLPEYAWTKAGWKRAKFLLVRLLEVGQSTGTMREETLDLLSSFFDASTVFSDEGEQGIEHAVKTDEVFLDCGSYHFRLNRFRSWLEGVARVRWPRSEQQLRFAQVGCRQRKIPFQRDGRWTSKLYWGIDAERVEDTQRRGEQNLRIVGDDSRPIGNYGSAE